MHAASIGQYMRLAAEHEASTAVTQQITKGNLANRERNAVMGCTVRGDVPAGIE